MKIVFTYNQVCLIQIAAVRRSEIYELVRSYLGVPDGRLWTNLDLKTALTDDTFTKYSLGDSADIYFSIRGTEFCLQTVLDAIDVEIAIEDIQTSLNYFTINEASLSTVAKTVKRAKALIDAVEW